MRVGSGYDVHRLVENRKLILGGVEIPYEKGLLGHSDADVLAHAIADALLGAAALGDIGKLFPDTDPRYEGADSLVLLGRVCALLGEKGYSIGNIDATVIAQKPKLAPSYWDHAGKSGGCLRGFHFPGQRKGHYRGGTGIYGNRGRHCGFSGVFVGGLNPRELFA